jgi:hypothetical protein
MPTDFQPHEDGLLLETKDNYIEKVSAEISKAKSSAANVVTIILACSVALLPYAHVASQALLPAETAEVVSTSLGEWLRIVGPILGTAIGALLGVSLATSKNDSA